MRAFPGRIKAQYSLPVRYSLGVTASCFAVSHQLFQHGDVNKLKPVAFIQAPILIPGFDQISAIESDSLFKGLCLTIRQLLPRNVAVNVVHFLEFRDIQPQERLGVDANPAWMDGEQLAAHQGRLQPPDGLPQVLPGQGLRGIRP
jgi:hypothetical protein